MTIRRAYVASKWENKTRVRDIMEILRHCGWEITYDWTNCEVGNMHQAMLDLKGVAEADVLVGVFEEDVAYAGALVEVGAALALGKPVYILGDAPILKRCIFFQHPLIKRGVDLFRQEVLDGIKVV